LNQQGEKLNQSVNVEGRKLSWCKEQNLPTIERE